MSELKPCPFCGEAAYMHRILPHKHAISWMPDHKGSTVIECLGCDTGFVCDTDEEAISAWNTRQPRSASLDDELLWQEIFSLREKLKIAVEAIKSFDPEFDAQEFTHRLNAVDYDQLMEELSGKEPIEATRFTPEEREATEKVTQLAYCYVTGFDNGRANLGKGKSELGKKKLSAIATVRSMLKGGAE